MSSLFVGDGRIHVAPSGTACRMVTVAGTSTGAASRGSPPAFPQPSPPFLWESSTDAYEKFPTPLRVLHCDNSVNAIGMPPGMLVHASALDAHENVTCVELLRVQLGERVAPVHRLDKGTSGVLHRAPAV